MVIASVLTVQALFFADGGLLALGANIFNLGVLPCFVAYPLIYRPLAGAGAVAAARDGGGRRGGRRACNSARWAWWCRPRVGDLQPAARDLPGADAAHPLAIGLVEGLATAALVLFLRRARPDLLDRAAAPSPPLRGPLLRRWRWRRC